MLSFVNVFPLSPGTLRNAFSPIVREPVEENHNYLG